MKSLFTAALLLLAIMALLGAPFAHAAGYWTAEQTRDARGQIACYAYTKLPNGGMLGIAIKNRDQELYTFIMKPGWVIPPDQELNIEVSIDDSPSVTAHAYADDLKPNEIIIPVKQEYTRLFVHEVTAGHHLYIRFHGSEPDWNVSLWGSDRTYDQFFACAKRVSPGWAYRNLPRAPEATQPYYNQRD
jgi:hypothetical protein